MHVPQKSLGHFIYNFAPFNARAAVFGFFDHAIWPIGSGQTDVYAASSQTQLRVAAKWKLSTGNDAPKEGHTV